MSIMTRESTAGPSGFFRQGLVDVKRRPAAVFAASRPSRAEAVRRPTTPSVLWLLLLRTVSRLFGRLRRPGWRLPARSRRRAGRRLAARSRRRRAGRARHRERHDARVVAFILGVGERGVGNLL